MSYIHGKLCLIQNIVCRTNLLADHYESIDELQLLNLNVGNLHMAFQCHKSFYFEDQYIGHFHVPTVRENIVTACGEVGRKMKIPWARTWIGHNSLEFLE